MAIIGRPNERDMKRILDERKIGNYDVQSQDVTNTHNIFGPDVGSLKGNKVCRKEPHVKLFTRPIPTDILKRHKEIVICFDVMYVNGIPFTVSISRALKLCTAEALQNRRTETLLTGIKQIKMIY